MNAVTSPRATARMAGVFQFLEGLTATYGQVLVFGGLIVSGNAAATAANILGHQRLFWLGFASSIIGIVCHLVWALLMYELFKPVSRRISLFALLVIVVGCAVQALTVVFYLAPMLVLHSGNSLAALSSDQLHALAYVFIRLNGYTFNTYLVFFGLWCFLIGTLIFRSTFMPRILGVLLCISGIGWMMYLVPPVAMPLFMPYLAGASAIGELPLLFWMLVMAVNAEKWHAQAAASAD